MNKHIQGLTYFSESFITASIFYNILIILLIYREINGLGKDNPVFELINRLNVIKAKHNHTLKSMI
jgi:hypothetical protein